MKLGGDGKVFGITAVALAVIVGTWNGNWFPSGRAEHRANAVVEAATIQAAGEMLRAGVAKFDPTLKEDVVICLNEMRNLEVTEELAKATGIPGLRVAVVSGYRRRDRFDMQQDAILTTLPVASANWSFWKSKKGVTPPRGYAHATLVFPQAVTTSVYCVHLKSNYGATTDEIRDSNREKRRLPIEQLVEQEKVRRGRKSTPIVVAGDFNADPWREEFAKETIFDSLEKAGFTNVLKLAPEKRRWTLPNRRYGNSALDHVYVRGLKIDGQPLTQYPDELSDHFALFVRVK